MFNQIKYSARAGLLPRLIGLSCLIVINLGFGLCTTLGVYGEGGMITSIVLSSLALCGILIVNIIADFESVRSLFGTPSGYLTALTPVPGWKLLLGRILPMFVLDFVGYTLGIIGVVVQSLLLGGYSFSELQSVATSEEAQLLPGGLIIGLSYLMLLTAIFFGCALSQSIFYRTRARGFLGFLSIAAVLYVFSLLDLLLAPFAQVSRFGLFMNLSIGYYANPGMFAYLLLTLIKTGVLFWATAHIMERKINL